MERSRGRRQLSERSARGSGPGFWASATPASEIKGHRDGNRNTNLHGHLRADLILASVPPTAGARVCAERSRRFTSRRTRNPVKGVAAGPLHGHKAIHEPRRIIGRFVSNDPSWSFDITLDLVSQFSDTCD